MCQLIILFKTPIFSPVFSAKCWPRLLEDVALAADQDPLAPLGVIQPAPGRLKPEIVLSL